MKSKTSALLYSFVIILIICTGMLNAQQTSNKGLPLQGIVTFSNGNTFSFDHVAENINLFGDSFKFTDETVFTSTTNDDISRGTIVLNDIKSIMMGEVIEKNKKFYFRGMQKDKWQDVECKWRKVTIITRKGKRFENLIVAVNENWSCGSTDTTTKLTFVQDEMKKVIPLASVDKIEFE